jgi:hypothetical protein
MLTFSASSGSTLLTDHLNPLIYQGFGFIQQTLIINHNSPSATTLNFVSKIDLKTN